VKGIVSPSRGNQNLPFQGRIFTNGATEDDAARDGFDDHRFYEMIRGHNSDVIFKQIDYEAHSKLFDQWLEKDDRQIY